MIRINRSSTVTVIEQIRSQIVDAVTTGTLPAGARLPTVRGLATELGVSADMVARAYRALEGDGIIETRGRAGSFVTENTGTPRAHLEVLAREYADAAARRGIDATEATAIIAAALDRAATR